VLPEDEDYDTVAGLISSRLGLIPGVGDALRLEAIDVDRRPQAVTLTVIGMDHLRIDRVRLEHAALEAPREVQDPA
jgi:CBS domain containing-hemolysin-like protein